MYVCFVFVIELFTVAFLSFTTFNLIIMCHPVLLQPRCRTGNKNNNWRMRCLNELFKENYLSLTLCLLANCFNYAIKCL